MTMAQELRNNNMDVKTTCRDEMRLTCVNWGDCGMKLGKPR